MVEFYLIFVAICLSGTTLSLENEPKCYSRFDYEVQLLKQTLQNDIQMKQILEKLDTTLKEVEAKKVEFDDANEHLKTLFEEFKEKTSNDILEKLQPSIDTTKQPVILFNARTLKDKRPTTGSRLVYTTLGQNIGDAFDQDSGIFTAPVNGTYLFSAQISTQRNKWGTVKIVVNDEAVQSITKYNNANSYSTTSGTTVQRLEQGGQVWVKQDSSTGDYVDGSTYGWNQFSGVLLHM